MSGEKIHGFAALKKGLLLEPFSYVPHPLGDEDIEIKITHCGICASDIHQLTSGWEESIYPMIPGHEIVGKVSAVGNKVTDFKLGDRVGMGPYCLSCRKDTCPDCSSHEETLCPSKVETYNGRYYDGSPTYGGYAHYRRVNQRYAFHIPKELSSAGAAPLLCAGATTWSPFLEYDIKKGDKVGVLGIGGLGHLALKWGKALGCQVYALSSNPSKEVDARNLGASHFINIKDAKQLQDNARTLDYIIATGNDVTMKWEPIVNLLRSKGTLVLVGIPEANISFHPFTVVAGNRKFAGSSVAGTDAIRSMFKFAAEHRIESDVQVYPLEQVNTAIKDFEAGKPRYRFVLEVSKE